MIDKEEQRRRAAQFDADRLAQGLKKPTIAPIPQPKPKPIPTAPVLVKKPESKRNYGVEAFTNHLGQVIFPEDEVVVVTTGYSHCIRINKGKFIGVRNGKVICEIDSTKTLWKHPDGVVAGSWVSGAQAVRSPYKRRTTLQRNRVYALK